MQGRMAVATVLLALTVPAAAQAATIKGKAGGRLPGAGKGLATVRAVGARDLAIDAVAVVRRHRYRLQVPAGRYRLFATTIPLAGGRAGIDVGAGKVRVRAGTRKSHRVKFRRRARKRASATAPPAARAAFVDVDYPAVWVQHFTVAASDPGFQVFRKGLADLLITDLATVLEPACGGVVVEREHLDEVIAELIRQQGPGFDPSTRLPTDRLIAHNREVSGSLTVAGDVASLTVFVTDARTGVTKSVTRTGSSDRVFDLETSIVEEVARLICGEEPPAAYAGQVSGAEQYPDYKLTWSGNVRVRYAKSNVPLIGEPAPGGDYAVYRLASGSVHVILDGSDGDCTYHGEVDVTLEPSLGDLSAVQQGVDAPWYELGAAFASGAPAVPYTFSGVDCPQGGSLPIAGRLFMSTQGPRQSSSTQLTGSVTVPFQGISSLSFSWSLSPQSS